MTMNSATNVLLAQAVYAVGTNDWTKVINLVNTSKEIGANLVNEKVRYTFVHAPVIPSGSDQANSELRSRTSTNSLNWIRKIGMMDE